MNIQLETITVWVSEELTDACSFFNALKSLLLPTDYLVIGSYEWPRGAENWLKEKNVSDQITESERPYTTSFELNRNDYPHGTEYIILATDENLDHLGSKYGAFIESSSFIDHLLAYRCGNPIIPLVNYRYAFKKIGVLSLSGLYKKSVIDNFAASLGVSFFEIDNPILKTSFGSDNAS